jgi:hypothetical protein
VFGSSVSARLGSAFIGQLLCADGLLVAYTRSGRYILLIRAHLARLRGKVEAGAAPRPNSWSPNEDRRRYVAAAPGRRLVRPLHIGYIGLDVGSQRIHALLHAVYTFLEVRTTPSRSDVMHLVRRYKVRSGFGNVDELIEVLQSCREITSVDIQRASYIVFHRRVAFAVGIWVVQRAFVPPCRQVSVWGRRRD